MTFLGKLPASEIPGVGKKAEEILSREEILTVADVIAAGSTRMRSLLGQWGERLVELASGNDARTVEPERGDSQKSYSKERTLESDTGDRKFIRLLARELGEKLAAKLRADGKGACTVTVKLRYSDFTDLSRSVSRSRATNRNSDILESIDELLQKKFARRGRIRQVGVKLSGIDFPVFQEDLFDPRGHLRGRRDGAIDRIRAGSGSAR